MKKIVTISLVVLATLFSCESAKKEAPKTVTKTYVSFGNTISEGSRITKEMMAKKYEEMSVGDTIEAKFSTKINQVCQKKGCWIKVPLEGDKESFVKFKDYGFFIPKDAAGSEVVLNGKAYKSEISIAELKHYAEDEGKSAKEIAQITAPKITYSFLAEGVLLVSNN